MRKITLLGALGFLAVAVPVHAQTFPADMTIMVPEVEVRSGPTEKFYATSKLRMGERVIVIRQDAAQRDWLAIKPPTGSFSWIKADFVDQTSQYAIVKSKDPVPVKPGSSLPNPPTPVDQAMVSQGTVLTLLNGPPKTGPEGTWLMVLPPPTEVRYIPASAVRQQVAAAPPAVATPAAASTQGTLASLSKNPSTMPGNPTNTAGASSYAGGQGWVPANAPGNSTALSPTGSVQPTPQCNQYQWSVYGQLRRTAFQKDGIPMYVLEDRRGQALLYVSARPGFTLNPYIGKTVSVYGLLTYRSDDYMRRFYMTATQVAVVP